MIRRLIHVVCTRGMHYALGSLSKGKIGLFEYAKITAKVTFILVKQHIPCGVVGNAI